MRLPQGKRFSASYLVRRWWACSVDIVHGRRDRSLSWWPCRQRRACTADTCRWRRGRRAPSWSRRSCRDSNTASDSRPAMWPETGESDRQTSRSGPRTARTSRYNCLHAYAPQWVTRNRYVKAQKLNWTELTNERAATGQFSSYVVLYAPLCPLYLFAYYVKVVGVFCVFFQIMQKHTSSELTGNWNGRTTASCIKKYWYKNSQNPIFFLQVTIHNVGMFLRHGLQWTSWKWPYARSRWGSGCSSCSTACRSACCASSSSDHWSGSRQPCTPGTCPDSVGHTPARSLYPTACRRRCSNPPTSSWNTLRDIIHNTISLIIHKCAHYGTNYQKT